MATSSAVTMDSCAQVAQWRTDHGVANVGCSEVGDGPPGGYHAAIAERLDAHQHRRTPLRMDRGPGGRSDIAPRLPPDPHQGNR